jgi:hypothetical protein
MKRKIIFEDIDKYLDSIILFDESSLKKKENIKNQLFRADISLEFLIDFIHKLFQIELNTTINYSFSKKTLTTKNIKNVINENMEILKKIYIKCKHKIYLENLNEKKIITLIRQLLRIHKYDLKAKEKYENGKKYLLYTISKKFENNMKKINSTINFD